MVERKKSNGGLSKAEGGGGAQMGKRRGRGVEPHQHVEFIKKKNKKKRKDIPRRNGSRRAAKREAERRIKQLRKFQQAKNREDISRRIAKGMGEPKK